MEGTETTLCGHGNDLMQYFTVEQMQFYSVRMLCLKLQRSSGVLDNSWNVGTASQRCSDTIKKNQG